MSEQLVIWRFNVIPAFEAHYQSNTCDSLATVRGKLKIVDGLAFVAFERPPLKSGYTVLPESHNAHVWRQVGCGWIKLRNIVHLCSWFVPNSFLAPFDILWHVLKWLSGMDWCNTPGAAKQRCEELRGADETSAGGGGKGDQWPKDSDKSSNSSMVSLCSTIVKLCVGMCQMLIASHSVPMCHGVFLQILRCLAIPSKYDSWTRPFSKPQMACLFPEALAIEVPQLAESIHPCIHLSTYLLSSNI